MQVLTKKQIKIELDQQDITSAVRDFLAKHGHSISDAELEEINYVKSPKDGLRATLNITEETGMDEVVEAPKPTPTPTETPVLSKETPVEAAVEEPTPEPTQVVADEEVIETEDPGEVSTSTVEDVMPSVDEVKQIVEQQVDEEEEQVPAPTEPRASLFL